MCFHAIVTFLEQPRSLASVDTAFRHLAVLFHRIPSCATFGVSCAGHFYLGESGKSFVPKPCGSLSIAVDILQPHISDLMQVISQTASEFTDISFQEIQHIFGPPKGGRVQVWEIRTGDAGCLSALGRDYFGDWLFIAEHSEVYNQSQQRNRETVEFWRRLTDRVFEFCQARDFGRFDLEGRVQELADAWSDRLHTAA